jgi:hypothetical protein
MVLYLKYHRNRIFDENEIYSYNRRNWRRYSSKTLISLDGFTKVTTKMLRFILVNALEEGIL